MDSVLTQAFAGSSKTASSSAVEAIDLLSEAKRNTDWYCHDNALLRYSVLNGWQPTIYSTADAWKGKSPTKRDNF